MKDYNKFKRGSEWHKWDLHFHTPSSYDYKDKSVSNQDIRSRTYLIFSVSLLSQIVKDSKHDTKLFALLS